MQITLEEIRKNYRNDILSLANKHDLENIRVFGSVARGDANKDSDLDLLVSRKKGGDPWGIGGFYTDMQEMFDCKVDVAMEGGLSKYIRDNVMNEAVKL